MRYFRLARTVGGALPPSSPLYVGAIIRHRKPLMNDALWNPETSNWVIPVWVECADPREDTVTNTEADAARYERERTRDAGEDDRPTLADCGDF